MKTAGLIFGEEAHYLDHLAPLCKILSIPLIVTEDKIASLSKKYYPHLQVIQYDPVEAPSKIITYFDLIFTCLPKQLFEEIFFFQQAISEKKLRSIWVPHGNSDKGRNSPFMEALKEEEIQLVYGSQMAHFLEEKGALKNHIFTGNFRYRFYQKNRAFYSDLVSKEITSFFKEKPKKILLYAPTWEDLQHSSSFVSAALLLLKNLPADFALIVKPHPNLFKQQGGLIKELRQQYKAHPHILFLEDFPPIYPLLSVVDIYIGDMSSIGYDFLVFNRPLFFLNENGQNTSFLSKSGTVIEKEDYENIYEKIKEKSPEKQLLEYAFGKPKSFKALKKEIREATLCCH